MKKINLFSLVIAGALLTSLNSFAQKQQKTAYEQRVETIGVQLFKELGYTNVTDFLWSDVKQQKALIGMAALQVPSTKRNEIKAKLEAAEKLKTAADTKREKERAEQAAKRAAQDRYDNSDAGVIKKNINREFEKWIQKGEFEKQADYEARLESQSQKMFEQICVEQIRERSKSAEFHRRNLSPYDTETESFSVSFKFYRNSGRVEVERKSEIIKIPFANAEKFKENWNSLELEKNDSDWCFDDNYLCPTLITFFDRKDKSKYEFKLSLENQTEITYSFDDFGIENPYLKGYVFRYNEAIKETSKN